MPNPYLSLVESWKDLPDGIGWSKPDQSGKMEILAPLTLAELTVGSFTLRGTCNKFRVDRDVLFQLEVGLPRTRTRLPLTRIEWRPQSSTHKNPPSGGRPSELIFGSHHHTHSANWIEAEGRMREHNLPFADKIDPDPRSYDDFLDLVRIRFKINGLDQIGAPESEPKLV